MKTVPVIMKRKPTPDSRNELQDHIFLNLVNLKNISVAFISDETVGVCALNRLVFVESNCVVKSFLFRK